MREVPVGSVGSSVGGLEVSVGSARSPVGGLEVSVGSARSPVGGLEVSVGSAGTPAPSWRRRRSVRALVCWRHGPVRPESAPAWQRRRPVPPRRAPTSVMDAPAGSAGMSAGITSGTSDPHSLSGTHSLSATHSLSGCTRSRARTHSRALERVRAPRGCKVRVLLRARSLSATHSLSGNARCRSTHPLSEHALALGARTHFRALERVRAPREGAKSAFAVGRALPVGRALVFGARSLSAHALAVGYALVPGRALAFGPWRGCVSLERVQSPRLVEARSLSGTHSFSGRTCFRGMLAVGHAPAFGPRTRSPGTHSLSGLREGACSKSGCKVRIRCWASIRCWTRSLSGHALVFGARTRFRVLEGACP
ncbi:hypothetical protein DFR70_116153 [Nocardia tenerifensis]|uniref:Uncharacterized protein n=1 Tax=Nocardia tenerifensis TaxID=228006 RepID=A0A318JSC8_9NOCA|nr:hypothetical protein DFR70_116153 [Nocardia tenerifensis]